jgi:hypothetical protein
MRLAPSLLALLTRSLLALLTGSLLALLLALLLAPGVGETRRADAPSALSLSFATGSLLALLTGSVLALLTGSLLALLTGSLLALLLALLLGPGVRETRRADAPSALRASVMTGAEGRESASATCRPCACRSFTTSLLSKAGSKASSKLVVS